MTTTAGRTAGPLHIPDQRVVGTPAPAGAAPLPLLRRAAGAPAAVIAHRGASARAPENTGAAFAGARAAGASWIETDVRLTRDGVPVLLHDERLDRTTDGCGPLAEVTADELGRLDAGSWFAPSHAGTRVPRLDDLLDDAARDGGEHLLLELKGRWREDDAVAVVTAVRERALGDRVVLQSFHPSTVASCVGAAPDVSVGLLLAPDAGAPVAAHAVAASATAAGPGPLPPLPGPDEVEEHVRSLGLSVVNPGVELVERDPALVGRLRDQGVAVWVWTVDDEARWAALDALGVDGLITNCPERLLAWQARRSPTTTAA